MALDPGVDLGLDAPTVEPRIDGVARDPVRRSSPRPDAGSCRDPRRLDAVRSHGIHEVLDAIATYRPSVDVAVA